MSQKTVGHQFGGPDGECYKNSAREHFALRVLSQGLTKERLSKVNIMLVNGKMRENRAKSMSKKRPQRDPEHI